MKKLFFYPLAFFIFLWAIPWTPPQSKASEIVQIDAEIAELEAMKLGYEGRALRHQNLAEYLQFDHEAYLEMRRHYQLADENREKAEYIQKKIDALKARRDALEPPKKSS